MCELFTVVVLAEANRPPPSASPPLPALPSVWPLPPLPPLPPMALSLDNSGTSIVTLLMSLR